MADICGLKSVEFYSDSALTTNFTGDSMVPYPVPPDPADGLSINTADAGTLSLYVVATTEGNK